MSNSLKISSRWQFLRGSIIARQNSMTETTVTTTSELNLDSTQVVGTTHELIAVGDVTDDAVAIIENLHATATVLVGGDSAGAFVEWFSIPPGYPAAIIPQVGALASTYLKASAASTPVRVTLVKVTV